MRASARHDFYPRDASDPPTRDGRQHEPTPNLYPDRARSTPYAEKFINGDIHPGNLIRHEGQLLFIDWGAAHVDDPYLELVRMSFTLRTSNTRLLKYLEHYTALSQMTPTAQEIQRILLLQALTNIYRYALWVTEGGTGGSKAQGMITRLFDDERHNADLSRISYPHNRTCIDKHIFHASTFDKTHPLVKTS